MDTMEMAPTGTPGTPNRSNTMKVRAGSHQLLCVKEGLPPYMSSFEVAPNVTVEVACKLRPPATGSNKTWAWVTLSTGLAATAAGVGLVAWYYTAGQSKPGQSFMTQRKDYHENYYGFALLGVGAVTAGLSAYFFVADQKDSGSSGHGRVSPYGIGVAPVEGGAVASGTFRF